MKTKPDFAIPDMRVKHRLRILLLLIFSTASTCAVAQTVQDQLAEAKKRVETLSKDSIKSQQALTKLAADNKTIKSRFDSLISEHANQLSTTYRSAFTTGNWFVYVIGSMLIIALIIIVLTTPKDDKFPLGLPDGSIRAIIAILAIVLYVLISLVLAAIPSSVIAADVTKTLGTLVVAISAFYFGSKTAEQSLKAGADINSAAAKAANDMNCSPEIPPLNIIKQAIEDNKANWLKLYNAQDIVPGKKKSNETTNDLDCIVFKVSTKLDSPEGKSVPPLITYITKGKTFNIPTDVQQA